MIQANIVIYLNRFMKRTRGMLIVPMQILKENWGSFCKRNWWNARIFLSANVLKKCEVRTLKKIISVSWLTAGQLHISRYVRIMPCCVVLSDVTAEFFPCCVIFCYTIIIACGLICSNDVFCPFVFNGCCVNSCYDSCLLKTRESEVVKRWPNCWNEIRNAENVFGFLMKIL